MFKNIIVGIALISIKSHAAPETYKLQCKYGVGVSTYQTVEISPLGENGKCLESLTLKVNGEKWDRKWLCENGTLLETGYNQVYSDPEGDTVFIRHNDDRLPYELLRWRLDEKGNELMESTSYSCERVRN